MRYWIDGYNAIFSDSTAPNELEASRHWLIERLLPLSHRYEVVVVFDAPGQEEPSARHHIGSLEIVYTAKGESADTYLLDLLEQAKNPRTVVIVTRDRRLELFARDQGAQTLDPLIFLDRVQLAPSSNDDKPQTASDQERKRWFQIFRNRIEKGEE